MESNFVSVGGQLQQELGKFADSVKVTSTMDASTKPDVSDMTGTKLPSTFVSSSDAPVEALEAPASPAEAAPVPEAPRTDPRMAKVIAEAQRVRAERDAVKQERAQMQADMAELARYRQLKAIAKEDPVAWAEEGGYKPDEYATTLMEKGSMSPERRKILEQQKQLNELSQWKTSFEAKQQEQAMQQQYGTVQNQLKDYASKAGEQYDLVARTGSYDKVLMKIQEQYHAAQLAGEHVDNAWEFADSAFSAVEQELENQYAPMLESPKLRSRLPQPTEAAAASVQPAARKPTGINSKMRATSAPPRPMTEAERMQKAGELLLNNMYGRR